MPADNFAPGLLGIVTSLTRPPGCPRWQCARWLCAARFFPDPPGIVTAAFVGAAHQSPPCQRGVVWRSQTGGIPRVAGFHIGLYFEEVPAVESLSHGFAVPAPFGKGALRAVPADNSARWLSAIRYCPSNARYRRPAKAPLAIVGVVWRSQTGGIKGWQISTWVCSFEKAPTVNPSVTASPCQLPLAREPLECSLVWELFPRTHFHQGGFFHGNVCR